MRTHTRPDRQTARRGFTLLELLVVMAVILVLASITVAGFGAMSRGRALGQSAHTVRTSLMQAASYANQYNVRTRALCGNEEVDQRTRHYVIVEWYNSLDDTNPGDSIYEDDAWYPLGTEHANRDDRLAAADREFLSGATRFLPGDGPVHPLRRGTADLVQLQSSAGTDQIHFLPSGAVGAWDDGSGNLHGQENQQVGLAMFGDEDDEVQKMAVIILRASGLTYIEEAY
jgi:prepilin-type N-terminal cleavage/methylation domain-containing protein